MSERAARSLISCVVKVTQSDSSHVQLKLYHTSGKLREKSSVLSGRLKAGRVVDELTSTGRAFQTRAAMTGKARSPTGCSRVSLLPLLPVILPSL